MSKYLSYVKYKINYTLPKLMTCSPTLFLGIDAGTTAIKTALYDANGQLYAHASVPSPVITPAPGIVEQDMNAVWDSCVACVHALTRECKKQHIDIADIASIGVCGQGDGLWALDAEFEPAGNAILWSDQRAAEQVQHWIDNGAAAKLSHYCGTANWPGTSGSIFYWLQQHDAEKAKKVKHVLNCKDWINFKLTGALATDYTDATIPFIDLAKRQYAEAAFELLDATALKQCVKLPQSSINQTGTLNNDTATLLGLDAGLPVAVGAIDIAAMMMGMGLHAPGDVSVILGTTAVVSMIVEPHPVDAEVVGATLLHPHLPHWIRVLAPQCGTSAVDWFIEKHPDSIKTDSAADSAANLNALASQSCAGANGVLFLPFLAGERAPFVAPLASAAFLNLRMDSDLSDMARAVMEGVAYSLRHCFESGSINSGRTVYVTGGGARNHLWCDILASVLDTSVEASDASDHGLWGAALLGACAANNISVDSQSIPRQSTRRHVPNPDWASEYDRQFGIYIDCVKHAKTTWQRLNPST